MKISSSSQIITRAIVDRSAFRHNLGVVRAYIGPKVKIVAVVKAHAYGHGLRGISKECIRGRVDYLGVARFDEGLELRNAGITHPILVFEIIWPDQCKAAVELNLELTVSTLEGAQHLNRVAQRLGRKARVHIKVDTGMGRLGFAYQGAVECIESIARLRWLELVGVYSHFATSDDPEGSFAKQQLDRFAAVLSELERRRIEVPLKHMANSGAVISLPESYLDMVRPGIMLYGYTPRNGMKVRQDLIPVLTLVSKVSSVKTVAANTSISYGRRYYTKSRTRIATVPVGYGDGYPRMLTNQADALIQGKKYPIVGAICMDHLMVNVGEDSSVRAGDEVTLIGRNQGNGISCWDLAEKIGTIPYEITCLITPRVPRVFVG